jgi:type VI protein secretion system component Hcp
MAIDAYIQIEGIPGESLDDKHRNWIEILGYNFGTHQSTSATASSTGGASSGRATVTTFNFTKFLDSASCKLMEPTAPGSTLRK